MVWLLAILAALILFYILQGRAWLKTKSWAAPFFAWIEPIELALWRKSETILFSRLLVLGGLIPPLLDLAPMLNVPEIASKLPPSWQGSWTLVFTVIGIINEVNRRFTTKPLAEVARPDATPPEAG